MKTNIWFPFPAGAFDIIAKINQHLFKSRLFLWISFLFGLTVLAILFINTAVLDSSFLDHRIWPGCHGQMPLCCPSHFGTPVSELSWISFPKCKIHISEVSCIPPLPSWIFLIAPMQAYAPVVCPCLFAVKVLGKSMIQILLSIPWEVSLITGRLFMARKCFAKGLNFIGCL